MNGPLHGLTVVSIEQAVAAPFATRQLADLGARVIKVERTDGGDFARGYDTSVHGQSSYFVWLNRGKESLTLDLKSDHGHRVLRALLERADVLVQNLAPGAADRLGLGGPELRERHPGLITCAISGYGSGSTWSDRKAYDLLIQCQAGLVAVTGTAEEPARVGISVADIATGMYAYSGILTALYDRERTGRGHSVDVSLFDSLAEWMSQPAYYTRYGGNPPPRLGTAHATIAPYGTYRAADGRDLLLTIQNEREWARLCTQVLDRPDLVADPRFASGSSRVRNRRELDPVIGEWLAGLDADTAAAVLDRAGIANAGVNSVAEFLDHPVLVERDRWRAVQTPGGVVQGLVPPVRLDGTDAPLRPVPALGEHTRRILDELDLAPARQE
ncbi:CaiB/BaiF CoA transferase family protein [Pseudonocardia sp. RS010]|uniref:CaiB/BaiF CoA transferase family protein n=1 Tax=Pseudonocardia sp. RS010 TaxID=3385979 RepID=UPI0039A0DBC2